MIESIVVFGFLIVLGYLLGIIGFFRAGAARAEVRDLRAALAEEIARRTAAEAGTVPPAPQPAPAEAPEAEPAAASAAEPAEAPDDVTPPAAPSRPARRPDVESILTLRWAVWLGAVALLLAGVFLVRYASDQGLLGPVTRCVAAVALGVALLAGAGWLQRRGTPPMPGPLSADQAPAALAAGGVAILFGAAYGAGPFYDLVPPLVGFAGMAAASVLGLAAALRFGPLTAAVGIVGAFVSPALVASTSPSLLGLFAYLAIVTAAAQAVVRRTAWTWLGWAVTIAGAAWVLLAAIMARDSEVWAAAAFVPLSAVLGLILPAEAFDEKRGRLLAWGQFATIAAAGLVLEAAAPGSATRLAALAFLPLAVWRGATALALDRLPWLGAAIGLAALYLWNGIDHAYGLGDTLPGADQGLLVAAALYAAVAAGVGLAFETRRPRGVRWSALVAAVPGLALALCCAAVGRFAADLRWGLCGLLLAVALTAAAARAMRHRPGDGATDRTGAHAAGAIAALALAFGMTLHDQWLIAALALIVPGLAWIEARTDLVALRRVALVVALAVSALSLYWLLRDLGEGRTTIAGHPLVAYALPAAAFLAGALQFRRRADDALVALLEADAAAAFALFATIEVRLWFGQGRLDAPFGFDEITTLMLALMAQAVTYDRLNRRTPRPVARAARNVIGALTLALGVGLILGNPMVTNVDAGTVSLAFAYLVPGAIAALASRVSAERMIRTAVGAYAFAAGFAWLTLQVRLLFHPGALGAATSAIGEAELWCWSGAWLAYGIAIMVLGVRTANQPLRLAALGLVGLVTAKVFLVDMSELTGLWRVASFLGLGLTLIGLGALHRRFLTPAAAPEIGEPADS